MRSVHRVVLCADDFGLGEGVSRAILDLARAGRISATSAMTNHDGWRRFAPDLRDVGRPFGIGLHLTLTDGAPLGPMPRFCAPDGRFPPLGAVLRKSLSGRLPADEIRAEIGRQFRAFEDHLGRPPDFVDGHQHVHILPGIRRALLDVLGKASCEGLWLRDPADRIGAIARRRLSTGKAAFITVLATGFRRDAEAAGLDTNRGFSGFSPFGAEADARPVFEAAFEALGPRPLVMCHPGTPGEATGAADPIADARSAELAYLSSPAFPELLARRGIELVPRP